MKHLAIFLLNLYQKYISSFFPPSCRFYPSCSEYSRQAFQKYGFLKGAFLSFKRIMKCHPFGPAGIDNLK